MLFYFNIKLIKLLPKKKKYSSQGYSLNMKHLLFYKMYNRLQKKKKCMLNLIN